MLIYVESIVKVEAKRNFTIVGYGFSHAYCQTSQIADHESWKFVFLILFRDLVFVILMIWTSLYMVRLLCRHHRRAQRLHSSRLSAQPSPKNRATQSILFLVCCFVFFNCTNNFFNFYSFYTLQKIPTLEVITGSLPASYPTLCPFVLLKNNMFFSKFTSSDSIMRITCYQGELIS
jgi:vomeronasal1 receptor